MVGTRDFKKIGDFLFAIPTSHRSDMRVPARFYADDRLLDGITGDLDPGVLHDRRSLAEEGFVVVIVTVVATTGEIVTGPEIVTRGWVHADEAEELLEDAREAVRSAIAQGAANDAIDAETLRRRARRALGRLINERTRRRPTIIPVIMEV